MLFLKNLNKPILVLFLFIAILFLGSRLVYLDSGVIYSEPDEWSYDSASKSLATNLLPKVAGRPLLEQTPLFEYLGYGLNFLVKDREFPRTFISIRLISVIASAILSLTLFYYLSRKEKLRTALFALILFTITPMTIFYSKVGLREMLMITVFFLFYVFFERFLQNQSSLKLAVISGVFLGLAVAVKTTALIFFPITALLLAYYLVRNLRPQRKIFQELISSGSVLAIGLAIPVLLLIPNFLSTIPRLFKDRFLLTFFSHNTASIDQKIRTLTYYWEHLDLWLTTPFLLLVLLGLVRIIYKKETKWVLLFFFLLPVIWFLVSNEPRGRYFVIASPLLIIVASLGLDFLVQMINDLIPFKKVVGLGIPLAIFLLIIPSSKIALESTNHSVLEQAGRIIREDYQGQMVFSSFWPPIVQYATGLPTLRWSNNLGDTNRDHGELPEFSPEIKSSATEYIQKNDSFVLFFDPLDKDDFSERKQAVELLKKGYKPAFILSDDKPNFPEKTPPYKLNIYTFDKEQ